MIKKQRCPKCGELVDALYSPDWVCIKCLDPQVLKRYPQMKKLRSKANN